MAIPENALSIWSAYSTAQGGASVPACLSHASDSESFMRRLRKMQQ